MSQLIHPDNINFFKAFASETRLKIIHLLLHDSMNIKEISQKLNLSSAIISKHISILREQKIIYVKEEENKAGAPKLCTLVFQDYVLHFPNVHQMADLKIKEYDISIGNYYNYDVLPDCGLATTKGNILGHSNEPKYFRSLEDHSIGILWFTQGWLEYVIPSFFIDANTINSIEISLELSSCASKKITGLRSDYKSDIYFYFNDVEIAKWTSPGDFTQEKGEYTPDFWVLSQHGILKTLAITKRGTFIDHIKVSDVNIFDLKLDSDKENKFRISAPKNTENSGGLNLFGASFGNHNQGIKFKTSHY